MLFLNKKNIRDMGQANIQGAVQQAYGLMLNQKYNMPDRMHVADRENMLLLMPCFSEEFFATKLVSVFPGAGRFDLPAVNGVLLLCDNQTGQPLAVMDGAALTAERTGAVGGLAVACLAPETVDTAGIFGAGVQGISQARYLMFNRKVKTLLIHDLYPSSSEKMIQTLETEFPDVEYRIADDPEKLVQSSQVIIAATTSKTPLFTGSPELVRSKTFISIGSFRPDMKEFPDAVISLADRVYVDTLFAAKESGDVCIPLAQKTVEMDKIKEFAPVAAAPVANEGQTLFFKSVGMALFDLTVASVVYKLALEKGAGQPLDM